MMYNVRVTEQRVENGRKFAFFVRNIDYELQYIFSSLLAVRCYSVKSGDIYFRFIY